MILIKINTFVLDPGLARQGGLGMLTHRENLRLSVKGGLNGLFADEVEGLLLQAEERLA